MAFHTALRLLPSSAASSWPDTNAPGCAISLHSTASCVSIQFPAFGSASTTARVTSYRDAAAIVNQDKTGRVTFGPFYEPDHAGKAGRHTFGAVLGRARPRRRSPGADPHPRADLRSWS